MSVVLTIQTPEFEHPVRLPAEHGNWTEDEFFEFCQENQELRIERTARGEIIIMSLAGGLSGYESGEVFSQLSVWPKKDRTGVAFDSSTGFLLPNGGVRSPDAAWLRLSRLRDLSRKNNSFPCARIS